MRREENKFMAKEKNIVNVILDLIEKLLPLYFIFMIIWWFADRERFVHWAVYSILLMAVFVVFAVWRKKNRFNWVRKWHNNRDLLVSLRSMKPSEFEDYIADLFNRLGYKARAVGGSGDGGIDVIAEKNGVKHYIQCKKFITSKVVVGAVRDFYGALADHLAKDKGIFITTNIFTADAERFVEDKPIELIDGNRLTEYIHLAEKEAVRPAPNAKTADKVCPRCGGKLTKRTGKHGEFYGCSNFPKCRHTEKYLFSNS